MQCDCHSYISSDRDGLCPHSQTPACISSRAGGVASDLAQCHRARHKSSKRGTALLGQRSELRGGMARQPAENKAGLFSKSQHGDLDLVLTEHASRCEFPSMGVTETVQDWQDP